MTTITAPTTSSFSPQVAVVAAAVLALFLLGAVLVLASMGAPAVPAHDLIQNTAPIYIDTTPLSGPSMH